MRTTTGAPGAGRRAVGLGNAAALILTCALLLVSAGTAVGQSPPPAPGPAADPDVQALCGVWKLSEVGLKLAEDLKSAAGIQVETAGKAVAACREKPECGRAPERERLEKVLREAASDQVKAGELAATMDKRKRTIGERLEGLYGKDAIATKCGTS